MMKVARKHIVAAIETADKLRHYPKYTIVSRMYTGKDKKLGEFGWVISVLPNKK
jgi:hypothetical protein